MEWLKKMLGLNRPDPEQTARAAQLRALYGLDFPAELFEFWRWHQGLRDEDKKTFGHQLGLRLVGAFDVLRGKFDGVEPAYPAVLHWRFRMDPAELVTVISGDTDGLHWGYWFDDPERLQPVVAAYYARDAFELWHAGDTLFGAVRNHLAKCVESCQESIEHDPDEADHYRAAITAMQKLAGELPSPSRRAARQISHETPDGMGVVAGTGSREAAQRLQHGKELWCEGRERAFDVLIEAYEALQRPALAAIARAHRDNPDLPGVDILQHKAGHCDSIDRAMAAPARVRHLDVVNRGLTELPDLSRMVNLEKLSAPTNELQALPDSIAACTALRELNLYNNRLVELPEGLFSLPVLEKIRASNNPIRELPVAIGGCASLKILELLSSEISHLPDPIGDLSRLEELNLAGSRLRSIPDSIGRLTSLKRLSLHKNQLTELPDLSGLTALKDLGLNGNPLPEETVDRVRRQVPNANVTF